MPKKHKSPARWEPIPLPVLNGRLALELLDDDTFRRIRRRLLDADKELSQFTGKEPLEETPHLDKLE